MACNCKACWRSTTLRRTIKTGSRARIEREVLNVMSDLECAELDNDVNRLIFQGTWPGSVRILEQALEKARKHEQQEATERPRKRVVGVAPAVQEASKVS